MGGLTPLRRPPQAIAFSDERLALLLLSLPPETPRPLARQHARSTLRQLLGKYVKCAPDQVALLETVSGPVVTGAGCNIHVSLSYAAGLCLIGLSNQGRIGVDIVHIQPLPETNALARLYLPATARDAVLSATAITKNALFALHWAQMEARSKCLGLPLAEISVQREQALNNCTLYDCAQLPDYCIALARPPL